MYAALCHIRCCFVEEIKYVSKMSIVYSSYGKSQQIYGAAGNMPKTVRCETELYNIFRDARTFVIERRADSLVIWAFCAI